MKNLILTLVFALAFLGCDRNSGENEYNPQLPPITQTGANTFGAIINGKVMVPRNSIGYVPPGSDHYAVSYASMNKYERIGASDSRDTRRGGIYMYIKNPLQQKPLNEGEYIVQDSNGAFSDSFADGIMMNCGLYVNNAYTIYLSIANTGKITITKSDPNIIAGTFSCKLKNKDNPNDIIEITDGRFDFDRNTINTTNFP